MSLKNLGSVINAFKLFNEQVELVKDGTADKMWLGGVSDALKDVSADAILAASSTLGLSSSQVACLLSAKGLTAAEIASKLAAEGYSQAMTISALKVAGFTSAQASAATANVTFKTTADAATVSTLAFGESVKRLSVGLLSLIIAHPIVTTLIAISAATAGLVVVINHYNKAAERARENLKELQDEFRSNAEELKTIESELESVTARISELDGKTLTITEAEELQNLQAQNNELSRQIELLKLRQDIKQQQVNDAFVEAMNTDLYRRDYSTFDSAGSAIQITEAENIENQIVAYENTLSQLKILDARFQEDLAEAQKDNDKKRIKKLEAQYDEDKQRLEEAQTEILTYLSGKQTEFSEALSGVSYTEQTADLFNFVKDFEDRLLILRGDDNAKTNALNRLINGEFDEATSALQELGKQGQVTATDLNDPAYSDFIQKLLSIGFITDTTNESLAFVAAGFNSLATDESVAATGVKDFASVMPSITEGLDSTQEKISTLSGALSSFYDGTLEASEVVDLLQKFPELASYVDLAADGFGNLGDGLKELIKNSPKELIDDLKEFKKTRDLTDDAAAAVDNLIDYLTDMPVDAVNDVTKAYGLMEDAITGAKRAASDLDDILSGPDHDDLYKADIEYFEKLKELLKEGKVGSEKYKALLDHFGLEGASSKEVQAWIKEYNSWYDESGKGIHKFLNEVKQLSGKGGALEGIMEYDGKEFWFDKSRMQEAADILGLHIDRLTALVGGVQSISEGWTDSIASMYGEFSSAAAEYTEQLSDGRVIVHLEDIMAYFHKTKEEAIAFADEVKKAGLANLHIIDDSALKDWGGFADSTNRTTEEINSLAQALRDAGMSTSDINNFVHGNWAQLAANFDTVLKPLLEDLKWSQEEIDILRDKLMNIPSLTADESNLAGTEVVLQVNDEEIGVAIESTDQLCGALEDLPDSTTLTLIDETGKAREGLQITESLLSDIKENNYQKIIIDYQTAGVAPVKDYGANESHDNSAYHTQATGTHHAKRGLTLLGDEYSPDGSPKPELVVSDGYAYVAGENGPEIQYLNDGDQVYPADKTKRILSGIHKNTYRLPAHAAGTALDTAFIGSKPDLSTDAKRIEYEKERLKVEKAILKEQARIVATATTTYLKPDPGSGTGGTPNKKSGSGTGSGSSGSASSSSKKSEFEKLYDKHQHLVAMDKETNEEYLAWLEKAYAEAYKKGDITLEDSYKYEEEVFNLRRENFADYLNDAEHKIEALENSGGSAADSVALYQEMIVAVQKQIDKAYEDGLDDNSDYIQELKNYLWDYQSSVEEIQETAIEDAKDAVDELVEYRIDMLKQEIEDEKDALEEKLDSLKDFYDKQKDLLKETKEEEEYLEEQQEKRRDVDSIRSDLSMLERDDSAWAQKRKEELRDELKKAEQDLSDFEKDHALDEALAALDKQQEAQETVIQAEIDALDKKLNDPHALYNQALADIKNNTADLYNEFVQYNREHGSGNDEDVKEMWESAYIALENFSDLNGENYKGIDLNNATGYEKPKKKEEEKPKAPAKTEDKNDKKPANDKKKDETPKSNKPSLKKGSSVTVKKSATHFSAKSGNKKMSSAVPGGKYTVYNTSGNQVLIGRNGEYTGWIKKSDIVGYKSGTDYSIAGLARFDEEGRGSEYIFESSNGNRYRMFGEGSKVLNANATNFLYDFATTGGTMLADMIRSSLDSLGLNKVARPMQTIQLSTGDIIIQGNASQQTVSEIRRAQRENLEFVLKEFGKLNK